MSPVREEASPSSPVAHQAKIEIQAPDSSPTHPTTPFNESASPADEGPPALGVNTETVPRARLVPSEGAAPVVAKEEVEAEPSMGVRGIASDLSETGGQLQNIA